MSKADPGPMRWTPFALAVLLVAAPAMSGCIGFGGDGDGEDLNETSAENDTPSGENDSAEGNESGEGPPGDANETGSENETQEDGGDATWTYDNRTGTVSGTNAIVTSSGSAEETFNVDPNTLKLALNLSAEGGELEMCLTQPGGNESGGNESGNTSQESCDETVTTEDGNASFTAESPTEGEWKATLRPAEPGHHSIDYELAIAQLVQQEEGF